MLLAVIFLDYYWLARK